MLLIITTLIMLIISKLTCVEHLVAGIGTAGASRSRPVQTLSYFIIYYDVDHHYDDVDQYYDDVDHDHDHFDHVDHLQGRMTRRGGS